MEEKFGWVIWGILFILVVMVFTFTSIGIETVVDKALEETPYRYYEGQFTEVNSLVVCDKYHIFGFFVPSPHIEYAKTMSAEEYVFWCVELDRSAYGVQELYTD